MQAQDFTNNIRGADSWLPRFLHASLQTSDADRPASLSLWSLGFLQIGVAMLVYILDDSGRHLDAKIDVAPGAVSLHSRGGARGKPNLRNPDYRAALRLVLGRLTAAKFDILGIWLDSAVALQWPESERLLVAADEIDGQIDKLVSAIGKRAAAKGRPDDAGGHGNSTKRIRIVVTERSEQEIVQALQAVTSQTPGRLPAATQRLVTSDMIDEAIETVRGHADHSFADSREYDVLLPSGERLSPKSVFGVALGRILGRPAHPGDFSAGWDMPCFEIIEAAGYPIVRKGTASSDLPADADDERIWAEGSPKAANHIRK